LFLLIWSVALFAFSFLNWSIEWSGEWR
jgi:hypothetical protein